MRVTCLRCGQQVELQDTFKNAVVKCLCGGSIHPKNIVRTGIHPNPQAAQKLREHAFVASGMVHNVGGLAFTLSLFGILFFPLALAGTAVALYQIIHLKGPVGLYSGRRKALWSLVLGPIIFFGEGIFIYQHYQQEKVHKMFYAHVSAFKDLQRFQGLQDTFFKDTGRYGTFNDIRFESLLEEYTLYLDDHTFLPAAKVSPHTLPDSVKPHLSHDTYQIVAIANLDSDPQLDIWAMGPRGPPMLIQDDTNEP
jgi:hypothetical protein